MADVQEILDYVEHETDLDLIAITDHDEIRGAFEARDLVANGNYRFEVIVGMEASTLGGHLLAYDLQEPVPMYRSLSKTIRSVHEQGGFCVVPHPTSWLTTSVGERRLNSILSSDELWVDGIEIVNPSFAGKIVHEKAKRLNRSRWHLPETGGSDSHTLSLIGTGRTLFPGQTADDFRRALRERMTVAQGEFWGLREHKELSGIAVQQTFKSWVILPGRKLKQAARHVSKGNRS
jgi:predicted metal-dependent phosphoesterase TrpH